MLGNKLKWPKEMMKIGMSNKYRKLFHDNYEVIAKEMQVDQV